MFNYAMDSKHMYTSADTRERAEEMVRSGWPEMRAAFYGAQEEKLKWDARLQGSGIRKTAANTRTSSARGDIDDLFLRFRLAGQTPTEEDLRPLQAELSRCEESEAAADAEVAMANEGLAIARYIANKLVNTLAEWSFKGMRLRKKLVKLGRGDPKEMLESALARLRDLRAEIDRVRKAGTPVAVLQERVSNMLDKLSLDAFRLDYTNGQPEWMHPVEGLPAEHKLPGHEVATNDLLPLLMSVAGDEIRSRLMARVVEDHRGDTRLRLEDGEKAKRLATLRAQLLDLQREEAALRIVLAGKSREIAFPPDMDPLAILGCDVVV